MIASKKEPVAKQKPVLVQIHFSPEVIEQIDHRASKEDRTRKNMVEVLVKQALEQSQTA